MLLKISLTMSIVVAIEKGAFRSPSTKVANFTLLISKQILIIHKKMESVRVVVTEMKQLITLYVNTARTDMTARGKTNVKLIVIPTVVGALGAALKKLGTILKSLGDLRILVVLIFQWKPTYWYHSQIYIQSSNTSSIHQWIAYFYHKINS